MSSVRRRGDPIPWERFPRYLYETLEDWVNDCRQDINLADELVSADPSPHISGEDREKHRLQAAESRIRLKAHADARDMVMRAAGEFACGEIRGDETSGEDEI